MLNNIERFQQLRGQLYCFADNLPLCRKLLDGGVKVVQLRNKQLPRQTLAELARDMAELVQNYPQALLIVNDYVDIALECGAHGVHLGQQDDNYQQVLNQVPSDFIVGVSVETVSQAVTAASAGAAYLGAGAVFATPTKTDAAVIGLDTLQAIVKAVSVPVVAIGGVTLNTIGAVARTGVQMFAVISDINAAPDIAGRIARYHQVLAEIYSTRL